MLVLLLSILLSFQAAAATNPQIYYTDIISGPNSGGENNKGIYLSIFGKNFGASGLGSTVKVYINNVEVDNYRYLGASKGRPDIQQISVQIGALGNPTPGLALPIKVVVNGVASNTDKTFMVNPGRIFFVDNVIGNDATAVVGNIAQPFRYVQTPALYTGGAWPAVQPGDFIVMRGRGNANPWLDVGFEGYFMRFRNKSGTAPSGASGSGAIAIMAYPGEDVFIRGRLANGMTGGCISGVNGQSFGGMGQWVVISGLRIDCEGYDGPISQQIFGHNWRVVNNDLAASTAPTSGPNIPRMAGITGNGNNSIWYGNHIHDIQGSPQECHGIYIDGDGSYDIAYNNIHDIRSGNGFQVYVNGGNGSDYASNIKLHHNLIHDVSKHGINIADGASNNVGVWNNVVYNVQFAGIRFNTMTLKGGRFYNNTFYNTNRAGSPAYGAITNDWTFPSNAFDIQNNIFHVATGTPYNSGSNGVPASAGIIARNVWFNGSGGTNFDSSPVLADPMFVNAAGADFHLQAASPARGVGSTLVLALVTDDFDLTEARPMQVDIGAYQQSGSAPGIVNGACGSAHGGSFSSAPSSNLCSAGNASAVVGSGPWTWTCVGINGGSTASCSANLLSSPQSPPTNTGLPVISGSAVVGQTLSCSTGTWANFPTKFAYMWLIGTQAVSSNAVKNTYVVTGNDVGKPIFCKVTASNAAGAASAVSTPVTPTAAASLAVKQSKVMSLGAGLATVTLDSPVTANNWIAVALVTWNNAPYNGTISDSHGHSGAAFGGDAIIYVDPFGTMWQFVKVTNSGSYSLSFNTNRASFGTAYVLEISGADPASFLDVKGFARSGSGSSVSGAFATTVKARTLLLTLIAANSGSASISTNTASGWSSVAARSENVYLASAVQQRSVTAVGNYVFNATLSTSLNWRLSGIVVRGQGQ